MRVSETGTEETKNKIREMRVTLIQNTVNIATRNLRYRHRSRQDIDIA